MKSLHHFKKIFVYTQFVDMRKSIGGLSAIVDLEDDLDVFSGDLFVFCSKSKRILKALYWDQSGFAIWNKKLDKSNFKWPISSQEKVVVLKTKIVELLLSGADVTRRHKQLFYKKVV